MGYVSVEQKRKKFKNQVLWTLCALLGIAVIILSVVLLVKTGIIGNDGKDKGDVLKPSATATAAPTEAPTPEPYVWINETENTIAMRFNPPQGYTRVECAPGSFGEYLRNYPLKPFGEKALLFSGGNLIESESTSTVGVFKQQDQLTKNQQCADTCIMLYAEYLWENQRYDEIIFDFSSGFRCDYLTWVDGKRVEVNGNKVKWVDKAGKNGVVKGDYSYENFFTYLKWVYVYANTDSLVTQFKSRSYDDIQVGDIFVATSRQLSAAAAEVSKELADSIEYGHAIIVVDIAVNEAGEKVFMLAEGNTPSTECAVVSNPDKDMSVWFKMGADGKFEKSSSGIKWSDEWIYTFSEMKK